MRILLSALALYLPMLLVSQARYVTDADIIIGAKQFELYKAQLDGKHVAITGNHTSMIDSVHLVDWLLAKEVNVTKVFAPEHGFRGKADAGEKVESGKDSKTGLPIVSLYGSHKKPTPIDLAGIDVMLFDIQDVNENQIKQTLIVVPQTWHCDSFWLLTFFDIKYLESLHPFDNDQILNPVLHVPNKNFP